MKFIKPAYLLTAIAILGLIFTGCNQRQGSDTEIPYNRENAKKHFITLNDAAGLTSNFRKSKTEMARQLKGLASPGKSMDLPEAESFNRDAIAALLNQKGAEGMRIYLGKDQQGLVKMVLVAIDNKGDDITNSLEVNSGKLRALKSETSPSSVQLEAGQRCPTMCGKESPLNH